MKEKIRLYYKKINHYIVPILMILLVGEMNYIKNPYFCGTGKKYKNIVGKIDIVYGSILLGKYRL